jgi:hypothetical protein
MARAASQQQDVDTHVGWARRFVMFHPCQNPSLLGPREAEVFLTHPAVERSGDRIDPESGATGTAVPVQRGASINVKPLSEMVRTRRSQRSPVAMTREKCL